jgi:saccharopine dehydrogenase (NAD+, L-lysine-forming)
LEFREIKEVDSNMKKIIVLGGAGFMGSEVVYQLAQRSDAKITIADANLKKLEQFGQTKHEARKIALNKLKGRVDTAAIDVEDFNNLVQLMKNADLVVSTVGPFYKYGPKVVKASIAAGVNFVDINDDYDATKEALSLNEEARKAGITAVIGCGGSPGLTNMLAKYGADKMEKVDDIRIFWAESGIDPTGPAAVVHWFHITSGDVPMFIEGDWVNVKALSGPEVVEFSPPLGKIEVRYTGHAEPVTLPRYIKGVKNVTIKGALFPARMMELYRTLTEVGFASTENFTVTEQLSVPLRELTTRIVRALGHFNPEYFEAMSEEASKIYQDSPGTTRVEVTGERGGEKVHYVYESTMDSVTLGTAIPAAIGALMILDGKAKGTGVLAPEGAFDSGLFISEVTKDVRVHETETRKRAI